MLFVDGVAIEERPKLYLNGRGIRSFEGKSSVVKRLALSDNHLTSFVAEKGAFPNLTELYLTGNQLTSFVAEEGAFPKLEVLVLKGNQLTLFIAKEGAFPKLFELDVRKNRNLEVVEVSTPSLRYFWMTDTKIHFLDEFLVRMVNGF